MLKIPVTMDDHRQGNDEAIVALVEYGDYECPYCGMAYPIVKAIQEYFGDNLRLVFRNFPIADSHPHALAAAESAEFAATQKKFWEMHDFLYENQKQLEMENLLQYGKSINLPIDELKNAIENEKFIKRIENDFIGGVKSGVNGTPTFFINGVRHNGSYEYEELLEAVKKYIK